MFAPGADVVASCEFWPLIVSDRRIVRLERSDKFDFLGVHLSIGGVVGRPQNFFSDGKVALLFRGEIFGD
jgi:hypothetical protein